MSNSKKIYYLTDVCGKMIKTFPKQNHLHVVFNAVFFRGGKKLNTIEQADVKNFSALIRSYVKSENPDKIRVDFKNLDNGTMIWTKTFDVDEINLELKQSGFQGLGEMEVNELVNRKFSELERQKEVEYLSRDLEEQKKRNAELLGEIAEMQTTLDAKKQVEYYSNIIGMALPGLAKFFVDTPAGEALSYLAGGEEQTEKTKSEQGDQRQSILNLISEFSATLQNQELGTLYLLMIELEKDKENFQRILHFITQHKTS